MPGPIVALVSGPGIAARLPRIRTAGEPGPGRSGCTTVPSQRGGERRTARRARPGQRLPPSAAAGLLSHIGQRSTATAPVRWAPMPWMRRSTITTVPPHTCGSSASPAAGHPRRVHRRPPGPHDRRRRPHRLVGPRHTATTPTITTARRGGDGAGALLPAEASALTLREAAFTDAAQAEWSELARRVIAQGKCSHE